MARPARKKATARVTPAQKATRKSAAAAKKAATAAKVQAMSPAAKASYAAGRVKAAAKAAATRKANAGARAAGLSPFSDYAGCTVAALARTLELCGGPVPGDAELRALFASAGGSTEHGAYLNDVLAAAAARGLAGAWLTMPGPGDPVLLQAGAHVIAALPAELAGTALGLPEVPAGAGTQTGCQGVSVGPRAEWVWQVGWSW